MNEASFLAASTSSPKKSPLKRRSLPSTLAEAGTIEEGMYAMFMLYIYI